MKRTSAHIARISIDPCLVVKMLKGTRECTSDMPADARFVRAVIEPDFTIGMVVESESFAPVAEGDAIPLFNPTLTTHNA